MEATSLRYGSDHSGLVCGFTFDSGNSGRLVGTAEAVAWLGERGQHRRDQFIWLHFNLANVNAEKWLIEHAGLPEPFFQALHEGSRSTRIELASDSLIAVVNDVLYNFSFNPADIATLWANVDAHVVITARRRPLQSIDRLRGAVSKGEPIRSTVELLNHLLCDQADVLVNIVRDSIKRVDQIEDELLSGKLNHRRIDLGALRRVLVRLQRLLAPEPAALFRLLQRPPAWIAEEDSQELRQSTEEFSMVLSDMASLQERIKLLQEELEARVNAENNRSLFVLTIVTVLALPINILAGLFGMNVGGIPLAQSESGFWIVVGIVATFTALAAWIVFRRQRD